MESLSKLKIERNYVLVKPDPDHEHLYVKGADGNSVELDLVSDHLTEARHYAITGTVLKVPKTLFYTGRGMEKVREKTNGNLEAEDLKTVIQLSKGSNECEVEMELEEGDRVWFNYTCQISGNTKLLFINIEDHGQCLLVPYEEIFVRERDMRLDPVNGYIWIKDLEGTRDLGHGLVLPDTIDVTPKGIGEVVRVGKPITHHRHGPHNNKLDTILLDGSLDDIAKSSIRHEDLKPGMIVHFRPGAVTPLEYEMHESYGIEGLKKILFKDIKFVELQKETV